MHHALYHVFFYDFGKVMFHLYRRRCILFLWAIGRVRGLGLGILGRVEVCGSCYDFGWVLGFMLFTFFIFVLSSLATSMLIQTILHTFYITF